VDLETDYDTNLDGWLRNQAAALREGRYGDLDPENVAEELEGLARSDRRALKSHLAILIEHLLKWELQKDRRSNSWKSSIANARDAVSELLEETPSLERELEDAATKAFSRARRTVAAETGIKIELLPSQLPYAVDQLLDEKFLPLGENDG